MKVLVVGEGGRGYALVWALARSPEVKTLRCAPGSAGIARRAETIPISSRDIPALTRHAREEGYGLVVIGPEAPLVAGLADRLREAGVPAFGPSAAAAEIEGSKAFAKEFLERHGIPTARFRAFSDPDAAQRYLASTEVSYPLVLKADGLAAGKGVVIVPDAERAVAVAREMLDGRALGAAGSKIVVEDLLRGNEVSFFVLSDGEAFVELATCRDYKRVEDGDRGPNTGGMGAYSPSVHLDEAARREIARTIVAPTLAGLAAEGRPYRGVLYVGLMLTDLGPKVLEFNARFGDPETQVLLPRLDEDWLPLLQAAAQGSLRGVVPRWRKDAAVCVVLASGGYPGSYAKGLVIQGIEDAEAMPGVLVFHAGTSSGPGGGFTTSGGRVLGVTALGPSVGQARERAYEAAGRVRWNGMHLRRDIAVEAVAVPQGGKTP